MPVKGYILKYIPKKLKTAIHREDYALPSGKHFHYWIKEYEFRKMPPDAIEEVEIKDPTLPPYIPLPDGLLYIHLNPRKQYSFKFSTTSYMSPNP